MYEDQLTKQIADQTRPFGSEIAYSCQLEIIRFDPINDRAISPTNSDAKLTYSYWAPLSDRTPADIRDVDQE